MPTLSFITFFLRFLLYVFLISRDPSLPIPDRLLVELLSSTQLLGYIFLGLGIITLINFAGFFCESVSFIPLNVRLNMLKKGAGHDSKLVLFLLKRNMHIAVFLALYSSEVGSVVYLFNNYAILDLLCIRALLLSIHWNNFVFNLGLDLCQKLIMSNYRQFFYPLCKTHELTAFWIFALLILLSSDVHPNPGPPPQSSEFSNGFLSFCNWNLNTLSKDNFSRVSLLQAHNTIFKYDIISLCETSSRWYIARLSISPIESP